MSKEYKQQSKAELDTARTLNTVAMVGGTHALVASTPDAWKRKIPGHGTLVAAGQKVKAKLPKVPEGATRAGKIAAVAVPVGWLGFHGAELSGDVMARRSINNQARQLQTPVAKAVALEFGEGSSRGRRIVEPTRAQVSKGTVKEGLRMVGEYGKKPTTTVAAERLHLAGGKKPHGRLERVTHPEKVETSKGIVRDFKNGYLVSRTATESLRAGGMARREAMNLGRRTPATVRNIGTVKYNRAAGLRTPVKVGKARRYDSEADRQRRIGYAGGAAAGAGIVTGDIARRNIHLSSYKANGYIQPSSAKRAPGTERVKLRATNLRVGRKGAIAAGATGVLGATALGALKYGTSERNKTWT